MGGAARKGLLGGAKGGVKGFLGQRVGAAGIGGLGGAASVLAAGAAGYAVGTAFYKAIEGTKLQSKIIDYVGGIADFFTGEDKGKAGEEVKRRNQEALAARSGFADPEVAQEYIRVMNLLRIAAEGSNQEAKKQLEEMKQMRTENKTISQAQIDSANTVIKSLDLQNSSQPV
ncbi:hypothetical protein LCGC14_0838900 [marine sediment metagenome]|uniref:Uncharacterized protein n=1 Tax=marine sediment metagenome TaxID=412755 RepID=A0A0F9RYG4_9ZZZZ